MPLVLSDQGQADDIRRQNSLLADPSGDVTAESAFVHRVVSAQVVPAEFPQSRLDPISNRLANGFGIEERTLRFRQVKAVFPSVAQSRGPIPGHRVGLVPEVIVDRIPAAFA